MDSEVESVCCREVENVDMKRDSFSSESQEALQCITEHPGFRTVCLDQYVLETAYYQYVQQYGQMHHQANERMRYVGYRQLARWCWGFLGKEVRVVLPACCVQRIRDQFPSDQYRGFQWQT
ncbi:P2X purinoceptor 7-like [Dreissena polymorpha]|nr:P2X purinoceptor 7-like [Dreissena polymorpha]